MRIWVGLLLAVLVFQNIWSQEGAPAIPDRVRVRATFLEITDASLRRLRLNEKFRRHLLPKGTDLQKLEDASTSFGAIEAVGLAGQKFEVMSTIEAALPESFVAPELLVGPEMKVVSPGEIVFGEPRKDIGVSFVAQAQVTKDVIHLSLHPKLIRLTGFDDGKGQIKSKSGKTFASFPTPVLAKSEISTKLSIRSGDTFVKAIGKRGISTRYLLITATLAPMLPPADRVPSKDLPPQVITTIEQILVPGDRVRKFSDVRTGKELDALLEPSKFDVVARASTLGGSGGKAYSVSAEERAFPVEADQIDINWSGNPTLGQRVRAMMTPPAPAFGCPRDDIGLTLLTNSKFSEDAILTDLAPKHVQLIGQTEAPYSLSITFPSAKAQNLEFEYKLERAMFALNQLKTKVATRPGEILVVSRCGYKNMQRVAPSKYVKISAKDFVKLEESKNAHYIYTIVRTNFLYSTKREDD